MQLAIPKAPRQVRLQQVPGALGRVGRVAFVALGAAAVLGLLGLFAGRWFSAEAGFFARAVEVPAKVSSVSLPKFDERTSVPAKLTVLYSFPDLPRSASGVLADAERAEGLGLGADVLLLVDPQSPESPREAEYARAAAGLSRFGLGGLGLGLLGALLLIGRELRRALSGELAPLRNGMLVWLTCEEPLPQTRSETTFKAHYFAADVKHEVTARARPGRAPVKNGEKVLAAVVPSQPTWVRVIDEDLARTLGWFA